MLGILVTLLLYFCLISLIAYWKKGSEEDYYQVKKAVSSDSFGLLSLCDLAQSHFLSDSGGELPIQAGPISGLPNVASF